MVKKIAIMTTFHGKKKKGGGAPPPVMSEKRLGLVVSLLRFLSRVPLFLWQLLSLLLSPLFEFLAPAAAATC
jgi:hypothetical protein